MSIRTNLDMDVLRTFVAGFELGSFARAADRLGRSQSAISTQLRRLEEQAGQQLVKKSGRQLVLTAAGESLFGYAKRILDLNDEAVDRVRGVEVEGWVRLGLPQDFAESWLPSVLGRFSKAHPKVRIEVRVERNAELAERALRGDLDLALAWSCHPDLDRARLHYATVATLPIEWIGRPDWAGLGSLDGEALPLIAFEQPCIFRAAGIAALDAAGIPWRVVFSSPSLAGLWAAAEAGLGVTIRTRVGMPKALVALESVAAGLPGLPSVPLELHRAEEEPGPAVARLRDILIETIAETVGPRQQRAFSLAA